MTIITSFEPSTTLSLNSDISLIAEDLYTLIYQHPYKNGAPRVHHGMSHMVRAMFLGTAAYHLLCHVKIENTQNLSAQEIALERQLIQIALLLHDSAREDDGEDLWDDESGINIYRYLTQRLNVSVKLAKRVAEAMRNKDWQTGQMYKTFNTETELFEEAERKDALPPSIERLRLSIQYGDCVDIQRVTAFERSYLLVEKKYPKNKKLITINTNIIAENELLIAAFEKEAMRQSENQEKNAYQFAQQFIDKENRTLKGFTSDRLIKGNATGLSKPAIQKNNKERNHSSLQDEKKSQIIEATIRRLQVINQSKDKFQIKNFSKRKKHYPSAHYKNTQTIVQLRSLLKDEYNPQDMFANVSLAVDKFIRKRKEQGTQFNTLNLNQIENLKKHCFSLIQNELRGGPHRIFSYHGCPREVSFAYDVYSTVNRILYVDKKRTAFRMSHEHFKKFMTITEFIDHFSLGGTKRVSDHEEGNPEAAISTNWSLFGNYENPSSCSLTYFLANYGHIAIDLKKLLKNILPSDMPPKVIDDLLNLYKHCYSQTQGGVLYQLEQSRSQASSSAYAAFSDGPENPYVMNSFKTHDPTNVRMLASAFLQSGDEEKVAQATSYLNHLEVRQMAPPSAKFETHCITFHHLDGHENLTNSTDPLLNFGSDLIYEYLLSFHPNDIDEKKSPGIMMFKELLASNDISYNKLIAYTELKRAFEANQIDLVQQYTQQWPKLRDYALVLSIDMKNIDMATWLLQQDPSLKNRKMHQLSDYNYKSNIQAPPLSLFEITAFTTNADIVMITLFGENWPNELPPGFTHTWNSLKMALRCLKSRTEQYDYAVRYGAILNDINYFIVSSENWNEFIDAFSLESLRKLLINHQILPRILLQVLTEKVVNDQQILDDMIRVDPNAILSVLLLLGEDNKELLKSHYGENWSDAITDDILKNCAQKICSPGDFSRVLTLLNLEQTRTFCEYARIKIISLLDSLDYLTAQTAAPHYAYTLIICGSPLQSPILCEVFQEKLHEKIKNPKDMLVFLMSFDAKNYDTTLYLIWKNTYPDLFVGLLEPLLLCGSQKRELLVAIYGDNWKDLITVEVLKNCAAKIELVNHFHVLVELCTLDQTRVVCEALKDKIEQLIDRSYSTSLSGPEVLLNLLGRLRSDQCMVAATIFKGALSKRIPEDITAEQQEQLKRSSAYYNNSWETISAFICQNTTDVHANNLVLQSGGFPVSNQAKHVSTETVDLSGCLDKITINN